jgi:hypothetical protein
MTEVLHKNKEQLKKEQVSTYYDSQYQQKFFKELYKGSKTDKTLKFM